MAPISSQNKPEEVAVREIRVFELLFACVLLHFGGKRVKACLAGSATHLERFAAFAATFTSLGVKLRVREKTASFKPMRAGVFFKPARGKASRGAFLPVALKTRGLVGMRWLG